MAETLPSAAVRLGAGRRVPARRPSRPAPGQPVQRVAVATSAENRRIMRDYFRQSGDLDNAGIDALEQQVGATNVVERMNVRTVGLLIRNGVTAQQLAQIMQPLTADQLQALFQRYAGPYPDLYRRLSQLAPNMLIDFVDLPAAAAPGAPQLRDAYGNYLAGPHRPAAYAANLQQLFDANFNNAHYYNHDTGQSLPIADAYEDYVRQADAPNLRLQAFADQLYTGRCYDAARHQIVNVANWQANPVIEQYELGLILGVQRVQFNPNAATAASIAVLAAHQALARQVVGRSPNADEAGRTLLLYLQQDQSQATLQYVDQYQTAINIDVLQNALRLNPARAAAWELGFLAAAAPQARLVTHLRAGAAQRDAVRAALFGHDGGNAPNLGAPIQLILKVLNANPDHLVDLLNNLAEVLRAAPHENDANLPFGNRAGGLRGHFNKHVLGEQNTDVREPKYWLRDLGLVPGAVSGVFQAGGQLQRQHFSQLPVDPSPIFGAASAANSEVRSADAMLAAIGNGTLGTRDDIAQQFENLYLQYVQRQYDASAAKYLYVDGAMVKINACLGDDFMVAGFAQNIFDFSSAYKPYEFGGAQVKWQAPRHQRLWSL
jgi:hypothetical protein